MKKTYVYSFITALLLTLVGNSSADIYRDENPNRVWSSDPVSTGHGRDRRRMARRTYEHWPNDTDRWSNRRWWDTTGYDDSSSYYNCPTCR
ncbi:hypothetical protein HRU45_01035 [Candidatus Dependentiae bacterium]|nr:hypothetical protein [Candidatus Dependentiae bacterium]